LQPWLLETNLSLEIACFRMHEIFVSCKINQVSLTASRTTKIWLCYVFSYYSCQKLFGWPKYFQWYLKYQITVFFKTSIRDNCIITVFIDSPVNEQKIEVIGIIILIWIRVTLVFSYPRKFFIYWYSMNNNKENRLIPVFILKQE